MRTIAALVLTAALAAAPPALAAPDLKARSEAAALAADRAFAARASVVGTAQAFREFMDPEDGLLYGGGGPPARGADAIFAAMGGTAPDKVRLEWTPTQAWGSAAGDLAVTTGDWVRTPVAGGPKATGRYVTVWRKRSDGSWKGLIDIGEADAPPK